MPPPSKFNHLQTHHPPKTKSKHKDENKESLAWKVLSMPHTQELNELDTVEKVQDKLAEIMNLSLHPIHLRDASLLDYYTAALWWAREQLFSHQQQSAMFTVIHTILENINEKHLSLVENVKSLKHMMVGIGLESCDGSGGLECFDVSQAKSICDYIYSSIFQHYNLYEFICTHSQAEEIIGTDLDIEIAPFPDEPWPVPLEEGISEEIYTNHVVALTPPTPVVTPAEPEEIVVEIEVPEAPVEKEKALLAILSPQDVRTIITSVFNEMLGGLQSDIASKLREKENNFIARINKIHKVAERVAEK